MWLFCCGMQRSGSTVQFQIAADLIEMAGLGQRVAWVRPKEFPALREKYAGREEWLVFKNHTCTPAMAAEFACGNAKGIYVYRDLRDVMVSIMYKHGASFEALWQSRFLAGCLYNYRQWTQLPGVLVSRYEDMIADLSSEVGRIANHLAIPSSSEQQQAIAIRYSLARQRQRIAMAQDCISLQSSFNGVNFDPHSNLHTNHIRSGCSGEWRQVLTERQVALVEALGQQWLPQHGYPLTTSGTRRCWATLQKRLQKLRHQLRRGLSR